MAMVGIELEWLTLPQGGGQFVAAGNFKIKERLESVRFLLDTGASMSVADQEWVSSKFPQAPVRTIGVQTTGIHGHDKANPTRIVSLPPLELGGHTTAAHFNEFTLMPLTHINQAYRAIGYPAVQLLLGSDIMERIGAVISYPEKRLFFKT